MSSDNPLTHEAFLRKKAREAIRDETLPCRAPDRVWGGLGTGARCSLCGLSVGPDQTELEIEFVAEDRSSKSSYHIVHLRCFATFEAERELLASKATLPNEAVLPAGVKATPPAA